jgi:Double zinc ribbon
MLGEALVAVLVGALVLWLVLQPLIRPAALRVRAIEPLDPEETPRGIALTALKEIEFDRETGKLSDADYQFLKAKYTTAALEAMRQDAEAPTPGRASHDVEAMIAAKVRALRSASAAPSSDASVTSPSTNTAATPACSSCGPRPEPNAAFCSSCGRRLPVRASCDRCGTVLLPGSRYCESCGRQVAA